MSSSSIPKYKVLFSFTAEESGELTVAAHQVVFATPGDDGQYGTADDKLDDWLLVMTESGESGFVPAGYVALVPSPPPPPAVAAQAPKSASTHTVAFQSGQRASPGAVSFSALPHTNFGRMMQLQDPDEEDFELNEALSLHDLAMASPSSSPVPPPSSILPLPSSFSSSSSSVAASASSYVVGGPGVGGSLSVRSLSGGAASFAAPIRRLSDPRLNLALLAAMDVPAAAATRLGAAAGKFEPPPKAGGRAAGFGAATTTHTPQQKPEPKSHAETLSAAAHRAAAHVRIPVSFPPKSFVASPSLHAAARLMSPAPSGDRRLFEAAKTLGLADTTTSPRKAAAGPSASSSSSSPAPLHDPSSSLLLLSRLSTSFAGLQSASSPLFSLGSQMSSSLHVRLQSSAAQAGRVSEAANRAREALDKERERWRERARELA